MRIKILVFFLLSGILFSCQSEKEKLLSKIKENESKLYGSAEKFEFDEAKARNTIASYEAFAQKFSDDPMAPEYLFKAADLYRSMKESAKALDIYNQIYSNFKSFEKAPHSLFLQGFVYENEINDLAKAREKYSEFLNAYPNHELTNDVRFSLQNLGKSPEEIIRLFEERQKREMTNEES